MGHKADRLICFGQNTDAFNDSVSDQLLFYKSLEMYLPWLFCVTVNVTLYSRRKQSAMCVKY